MAMTQRSALNEPESSSDASLIGISNFSIPTGMLDKSIETERGREVMTYRIELVRRQRRGYRNPV
jgi:hypothetical protein